MLRQALRVRALLRGQQTRGLKLLVGAHAVPHREKKEGEDAFFACSATNSIGVADGVGGSRRDGVDPGAFSRRLLAHARRHCGSKSAAAAATAARSAASTDDVCKRGGSSTLLVAKLAGDALELSNFGDSALALLRPAPRRQGGVVRLWPRVVLRTSDQTHYFNCPYQAAAGDKPETPKQLGSCEADVLTADARPGDLIVMATDGFWDNVEDDAAQRLIADRVPLLWASAASQNAFGELSPRVRALSDAPEAADACRDVLSTLAVDLCALSVNVFDDEQAWTPFSNAAALDGMDFVGGKEDDVSIVIGLVADAATALSAVDEAGMDNFAASRLPDEEDGG